MLFVIFVIAVLPECSVSTTVNFVVNHKQSFAVREDTNVRTMYIQLPEDQERFLQIHDVEPMIQNGVANQTRRNKTKIVRDDITDLNDFTNDALTNTTNFHTRIDSNLYDDDNDTDLDDTSEPHYPDYARPDHYFDGEYFGENIDDEEEEEDNEGDGDYGNIEIIPDDKENDDDPEDDYDGDDIDFDYSKVNFPSDMGEVDRASVPTHQGNAEIDIDNLYDVDGDEKDDPDYGMDDFVDDVIDEDAVIDDAVVDGDADLNSRKKRSVDMCAGIRVKRAKPAKEQWRESLPGSKSEENKPEEPKEWTKITDKDLKNAKMTRYGVIGEYIGMTLLTTSGFIFVAVCFARDPLAVIMAFGTGCPCCLVCAPCIRNFTDKYLNPKKLVQDSMNKYMPGVIVREDGTMDYYEPTTEEVEILVEIMEELLGHSLGAGGLM